ncbi:MAG: primosomal protein N' [Clostridia bacterium]
MQKIAALAMSSLPPSADKLYDYYIPTHLEPLVEVGTRVVAPFGGGDRHTRAIVVSISNESERRILKTIATVIDGGVPLEDEFLRLADFLKSRYFCNLYDATSAMLPSGLNVTLVRTIEVFGELYDEATKKEKEVYDFIKEKKYTTMFTLEKTFSKSVGKILDILSEKEAIKITDEFKKTVPDKLVKIIKLELPLDELLEKITFYQDKKPIWCEVLTTLKDQGELSQTELIYLTGVTLPTLVTLKKKGYISFKSEVSLRKPDFKKLKRIDEIVLNEAQTVTYNEISEYFDNEYKSALLFGITGSGKTLIYIKLALDAIRDNKGVIVMVPEISLTAQMLTRFYQIFGEKIAVIHSGLSMGERLDEYKRIKSGAATVVIGTRSAVFSPVQNLGLIVIDEEQEHTYKSESSPRYNTKEVAAFRAKENNAHLLMSSATPSVEMTYLAKSGKIGFFTLNERYNSQSLPEVITVDMRDEIKKGNTTCISQTLANEIEKNIKRKEQSIIFINRRGYNTNVSCRNCGHVAICPNCGIALTYHTKSNRMLCHYCNYSTIKPENCPSCNSDDFKYVGIGTQKVEAEIKELLPEARIVRMDADTTTRKNSHSKIIEDFMANKYDVLVGTQMVTKGLDFNNVTLAAIVSADLSLYSDDFRANETTFSLVTQLIGRSGRADKKGRAIIQTYNPNNKILNLAFSQNYMDFYNDEIKLRKAFLFPPFCDICQVLFESTDEEKGMFAAKWFVWYLNDFAKKNYNGVFYKGFGPCPAILPRLNNKYRFKVIIKCKNNNGFRSLLAETVKEFYADSRLRQTKATITFNPEFIC